MISFKIWGDGSLGTKNSAKEYLSLFQLVAILISGLEASFGKNSEEDGNGISSTTIERCSLSHLNLNNSSTPKAPEKGIFSRQNAGPFETYFNWDTHATHLDLCSTQKAGFHDFWGLLSKDVILRAQVADNTQLIP